jgi:hypothetical protein
MGKQNGKFCVIKDGEDKPLHCYSNKADAQKYMAALYANERAKMTKPNIFKQLLSELSSLFRTGEKLRAVAMSAIYEQVYSEITEYNPWARVMDVFSDDTGNLFAVVAQDGKLYRVDFTVDAGEVQMGEWVEVMQEFVPTGRMSIIRQADGRARGFLISSAAVLNRVGEIDSTLLHQNMNRRAQETGLYPYIDFFHLGEDWRVGEADFLGLDGYVAVASFLFDETPLGRAMVAAYEADPEYWGASISYYPIGEPEKLRAGNVEIPVYTDGRYQAITICPERVAASPFTALYAQEVTRMNQALLEALTKLAGDDEELKTKVAKFAESVDETNRTIENRDLIRRNAEATEEMPADDGAAPVGTIANTDTEDGENEAGTVQVPAEEIQGGEVVLDEPAIAAITEHVFSSEAWTNALSPILSAIEQLTITVQSLQTDMGQVRTGQNEQDQRLRAVEATDEQKRQVWEADLSRRTKRSLNVTYRPSQPNAADPTQAVNGSSYEQIAANTLANLKK